MRDNTRWVGTWTAAPAPAEGAAFSNHTLRMIPRVSIGGSRLRVRVSNAYGTRPLSIGAACVGRRSAGPTLVPGSNRRLTFGGEASATIAVGALVVSDPVELEFAPLSDLAVSVHLPADLPTSFGITGRYARGRPTTYRRREISLRKSSCRLAASPTTGTSSVASTSSRRGRRARSSRSATR